MLKKYLLATDKRSVLHSCLLAVTFSWMVLALQLDASESQMQKDGFVDTGQEPRLELFVSTLVANGASPEENLGLRGALARRGRFQLEGSFGQVSDDRVNISLVDLSLKYYFQTGHRTDMYLITGPGLFHSSDLDADELTLHVGFGAEFSLGRNFYLRPEVRGRWFAEDLDLDPTGDLSLGLGWRF